MTVDERTYTLLDYGDMVPVNASRGSRLGKRGVGIRALDIALEHGGQRFGCCPKTIADGSNNGRRVVIGNLGNNNPGKNPEYAPGTNAENALSLPRDLTLGQEQGAVFPASAAPTVVILQQFVPELKQLRTGTPEHVGRMVLRGDDGDGGSYHWFATAGAQLEIVIRFKCVTAGAVLPLRFGFDVLASKPSIGGEENPERTRVLVMSDQKLVLAVDRTISGDANDADVRAGPLTFWPLPAAVSASEHELLLHAYIDGSIVSVIAGNRTAVTAHVHPTLGSRGVAVFAEGGGEVELVSASIWELSTPRHRHRRY
jgi:hypothetical protein